jgi:D-tyrosyl-tRNA(Tyr) deacylase
MSQIKKAVYFLCKNPDIDPVAGRVYKGLPKVYDLHETDMIIDGTPVMECLDGEGNSFCFAGTDKVVCHDYLKYLPTMNNYFSDFDMAGLITWHGGQNAPDRILSVHTTGDVETGNFGPANPRYMHNLLVHLEKSRAEAGLDEFTVTTEATHWSGVIYGEGAPDLIPRFPVPIVDIEIGSTCDSWSNQKAVRVLAGSLTGVFAGGDKKLYNLLCAGGVHFEQSFAKAVFEEWEGSYFGISHILANHWLVSGQYLGEEGKARLKTCIDSIQGGIDGIVFHDNLKGAYKEQLRILGRELNVPVFKHQMLRRPADIPFK